MKSPAKDDAESLAKAIRDLVVQGKVEDAVSRFADCVRRKAEKRVSSLLGATMTTALGQCTDHSKGQFGRATLYLEGGFLGEAERCMRREVEKNPTCEALASHAAILSRMGRREESLATYDRAVAVCPDRARLQFERGQLLQSSGRLAEARSSFEQACRIDGSNAEYWLELGNVSKSLLDFEGARNAYGVAVGIRPRYADALNNRGTVHRKMGDNERALADFSAAIACDRGHLYSYLNRGSLFAASGRHDLALQDFEMALVIAPQDPNPYHGMGESLHRLGAHAEALDYFDAALSLADRMCTVHLSKGNCLRAMGQPELAIASFRRAVEIDPNYLEGYINWSVSLQDLGRHHDAIEVLDRALAISPGFNEACYNKANSMLCLGLSREAWQTYERRHHLASGARLATFGKPLLGEESPQGKVLLLQWDQRVGDIIHAMRYVPFIEQIAAKCYWQVDHQLKGLLSASHPRIQMIGLADCPADVTHRLPITSLPLALGTFDDSAVPRNVPYLTPSEQAIGSWRGRLQGDRPRVGVVWRGRPDPPGRSIPIQDFRVLFANPEIEFVSLQVDPARDELAVLNSDGVTNAASGIGTFDDTAAILSLLDLVVTIDTSVAHLSCALGRPTWILLKYGGDWRWRETGDGSVWYPTARIYRQRTFADWPAVISELSNDLQQFSLRCR